jgi:hypothetical protein
MSADVGVESTEPGDPENIGIAVGTASLSSLEREIRLLPVVGRHLVSGVGRCRSMSAKAGGYFCR